MKIYKTLLGWVVIIINLLGALAAEKIIGGFFYWGIFPLVFSQYGIRRGVIGLFIFQFVSSVIFIIAYDAIGKDLFKIVTVKRGLLELLVKIKKIPLSVFLIITYYLIGMDILKIGDFFERCLGLVAKIGYTKCWKRSIKFLYKFSWLVEFAIFSWQFFPLFALLCLRKVGVVRNTSRFYKLMRISLWDVAVLCASSIFATVFWTLFHTGLRLVIYDWLKKWI